MTDLLNEYMSGIVATEYEYNYAYAGNARSLQLLLDEGWEPCPYVPAIVFASAGGVGENAYVFLRRRLEVR